MQTLITEYHEIINAIELISIQKMRVKDSLPALMKYEKLNEPVNNYQRCVDRLQASYHSGIVQKLKSNLKIYEDLNTYDRLCMLGYCNEAVSFLLDIAVSQGQLCLDLRTAHREAKQSGNLSEAVRLENLYEYLEGTLGEVTSASLCPIVERICKKVANCLDKCEEKMKMCEEITTEIKALLCEETGETSLSRMHEKDKRCRQFMQEYSDIMQEMNLLLL